MVDVQETPYKGHPYQGSSTNPMSMVEGCCHISCGVNVIVTNFVGEWIMVCWKLSDFVVEDRCFDIVITCCLFTVNVIQ